MNTTALRSMQVILPVLVLVGGMAGSWALLTSKPVLEPKIQELEPPLVDVIQVHPRMLQINVHSQGVVQPRDQIDMVPEVAGKIVHIHQGLVPGGFFEAGDLLYAVDPRDYDYAVVDAKAAIAQAQHQVLFEEAQAEQARSEWLALGEGEPTPLALREPQLAEARAKLQAAEADLERAKLRRKRCELHAPFDGRVLEKYAGLGQYVQTGDKLARVYATDVAEVRLPVAVEQLGFLDLPLSGDRGGPDVLLTTELAGVRHRWDGRIVRTEGSLDEASGLLHLVAEVRRPYQRENDEMPLMAGLFVQAEIEGREQTGLFELPAGAVNSMQEAWFVDQDDRLRIRRLEVLHWQKDRIWVKSGLNSDDRIVLAGLQVPVEGMKVRMKDKTSEVSGRDNLAALKSLR